MLNPADRITPRVAPPNLPIAPVGYSQSHENKYSNVLRLFFNTLVGSVNSAIRSSTGAYVSLFDTTNQTTGANTPKAITFNTLDIAYGIYIGSPTSRIYFSTSGVYNIQFSVQYKNTTASIEDLNIWLRIDGVDVPGSNGLISVTNKHAGANGHGIVGWNFLLAFAAGQYMELIWCPSIAAVTLAYLPAAAGPPTIPATYSVVFTASTVALL